VGNIRSRLQKNHPQELANRRAIRWDGHGEPCRSPTLYFSARWGTTKCRKPPWPSAFPPCGRLSHFALASQTSRLLCTGITPFRCAFTRRGTASKVRSRRTASPASESRRWLDHFSPLPHSSLDSSCHQSVPASGESWRCVEFHVYHLRRHKCRLPRSAHLTRHRGIRRRGGNATHCNSSRIHIKTVPFFAPAVTHYEDLIPPRHALRGAPHTHAKGEQAVSGRSTHDVRRISRADARRPRHGYGCDTRDGSPDV
jgi:hypothetical protein